MRKVILIFGLFFLFMAAYQTNYALDKYRSKKTETKNHTIKEDKWLGWDKFGHFFISGFLSGTSYSIYHKSFNNDKESSILFSSSFTLSLGVGKEINDMKKPQNKFSYKDLIFDLMGISFGLIIASQ